MFGSLLLCYWSVSVLHLSSTLVHENLQLNNGANHRGRPSFLSDTERSPAIDFGTDLGLIPVGTTEDHFMSDATSDNEDSSASTQLQGRMMRSPRRCIPHQQSCLGFLLQCCDPCDTCYCRFFNAICYCRRVGHTCPARRT